MLDPPDADCAEQSLRAENQHSQKGKDGSAKGRDGADDNAKATEPKDNAGKGNDPKKVYCYDNADRLISTNGGLALSFGYDAYGKVTSESNAANGGALFFLKRLR